MIDPTMQFDKRCETGIEGLNEILGAWANNLDPAQRQLEEFL